jgi:antitoxin ParD1/3/4
MSVRFPADVESNIQRMIESGRYGSEADVVRAALRLLDAREQRLQELRASIEEGLAAIDRGEGFELTRELMDEIDREVEERFQRGELPNPDVCP